MAAILKWMSSPAAEKSADAAKAIALEKLKKNYPNADMSKFKTEAYFDSKKDATADVLFKEGPGSLQSVSGSDSKYWSEEMKNALGLGDFPVQLTLRRGEVLPIPAVGFTDAAQSLKKLFNADFFIYVTPNEYFATKFREIFQKTKLEHTTGAEAKKMVGSPEHELLATAAEFCRMVCIDRMRDFT